MAFDILQLNSANSLIEFDDFVRQGVPSAVFGVLDAFKSYLISRIKGRVLLVVKDGFSAEFFKKEITAISNKKCVYIPHKDEILLSLKGFSKDVSYERITAINSSTSADVIITTPNSLMQSFLGKVKEIQVNVDAEIKIEDLQKELVSLGYKRVDSVESKGTFSVRGDIFDVFPVNLPYALRIDFFGDTVESIKKFDTESRDNFGSTDSAVILQAVEGTFTLEELKIIRERAREESHSADKNASAKLETLYNDIAFACENKDYDFLANYYSALNKPCDFTELFDEDFTVVIDEPKRCYDLAEGLEQDYKNRFSALKKEGGVFAFQEKNLLSLNELTEKLSKYKKVAVSTLTGSVKFFEPLKIITPNVSGVSDYKLDFKEFFNDVRAWKKNGYKVISYTGDRLKAENLCIELKTNGFDYELNGKPSDSKVCVLDKSLPAGFIFHEEKTVVIGSGNLYTETSRERKEKRVKKGFFSAPEKGDYCVHEKYGIGRVIGNKKISSLDWTKDYVAIEYYGGDMLYVPVDQMDLLTRYLGSEKNPKLSKIGGKDFERIKARVKESLKKMSFDLKALYNERNSLSGYKYSLDGTLQSEFENAFKYEDTEDQHTATEEVKGDMLTGKVMDRLICGDVGFGKTEVALRAVFMAVYNGKQAALLCPTTILSEQHYNTAVERFKNFGVRVAVLNRFKTTKEQIKILTDVQNGKIDFLIGTHRLLSGDVKFKDLGLLVLDEEQRFGVEHKEKIKLLKKNVDTLTLSATPIPRTLHMSLSGIRSISTINTPPKNRLPVQTYVVEESEMLIKDAVSRELNRGGQVFILYNRVESIFLFAEKVKQILPNINMRVVHGQMNEKTLEQNVMEFYQGKAQVLISTTIIENGIDLPKANTLIVIDADKLGLSTLYQLKGRVGRSDRLAYAYFTYKRDYVMTSTAYDRLNAIVEFAEMGSGIKIAMRDLEIRGAGNILGAEQHGHMDKIGYELYSKMLKEEISGIQEENVETDVRVNAYIPDRYIVSNTRRMDAYKEIAEINSEESFSEIKERIIGEFGEMPEETENLFDIAEVKFLSKRIGVNNVTVSKEKSVLEFSDFNKFKNVGLLAALNAYSDKTRILMSDKPTIEFISDGINYGITLKEMLNFLKIAVSSDNISG